MNRVSIAALLGIVMALPLQAAGQSLAEVARQEAARRKTTSSTGKEFTNADLKAAPQPSPGTTTAAAIGTTLPPPPPLPRDEAPAAGGQPAADAPAAPAAASEQKNEAYWRGRMSTARDNLARAQTFQLALQARIAALNTDFVNRDDPAQRNVVASDRQKAMTELDRVQKDITRYQAELTAIAEEARRAGAPAAWVR
jgi:hypothetical protein